ncbi:CbtA family protein [Antarcticirhabdus aurantiaca]|uniref:CbtA family protein n=1 Tax=Antarcticirhabdus aurantiaca TaxID=2606717 RepID=A0ACD4NHQ8_9HYPH|nr:CbtA family protein [Antarcticirhabdus aurantiaca]WAJ26327.1 CbtA family protein [Jeongeuplla avenae]
MTIFRNAVFLAALAGLVAGLALALLQTFTTVPLILQAETYETSAPAPAADHSHAAGTPAHDHAAPAEDAHGHDGWMPADGFERFAFTLGANIVSGIGFALLLVTLSEASGGIASWRQGLLWGLGGFAAFTLAPGLGLPPELPGMPAADLVARQVWWLGAVVATGAGLWLLALARSPLASLAGVALLVAPHLVGAPQPVSHETAVPAGLHHDFVVAVTVTNLLFWLVLGAAAGALRSRLDMGAAPRLEGRPA